MMVLLNFPREINGLCFLLFLLDGVLSEETFMKWAKPVLSDFKVRGSWGTIGNQDVAANSFLSVMSVNKSSGWVIDGKQVPYIGIPSVVSPSLTWERVTTY